MVKYRINDIYPCIQGEGCQAGVAMVIVRLQGCGVGCPWCDTRETWVRDDAMRSETLREAIGDNPRWAEVGAEDVAAFVADEAPGPAWVLITGGEPAEQELGPLVAAIHRNGYRVALETSGTALGHLGVAFDWVCISPKIAMPGGLKVLGAAFARVDEIKMVVGRQSDIDRLDALIATLELDPRVQICLQPVSLSTSATRLCLETAMRRGWRISIQIHKYLSVK